jgi:hypothetical protein
MSRKSLGIVAALLLVVGAFVWLRGPEGGSGNAFAFGCIRVGLVLGAGWLAYPQIVALIKQSPRWVLSWFLGNKTKEAAAANGSTARSPVRSEPGKSAPASSEKSSSAVGDASQPAPLVRKPRRRSNS